MVAYSFKSAFVEDIAAGLKCQTIRLPRPRHARPGERLQLFTGMRTKHCRKIIPDPVCIGVDQLIIDTRSGRLDHLEINGCVIDLASAEADAFAVADGFGKPPRTIRPIEIFAIWFAVADGFGRPARTLRPIEIFAIWWRTVHGPALHPDLSLIRWEPRP